MDAGVGDRALPLDEKRVLGGETVELPTLERVRLGKFYAGLDLSFVARHGGLGRQERGAVARAEVAQLRVELGVKPVGEEDCCLQIVDDQRDGDATEGAERVFQTANHGLGILPPDDLAVALARVTEQGANQVAPPSLAFGHDPGAGAKVDLHLGAGFALHPAKRQLGPGRQPPHEQFDRAVATAETVLADQILIDPLRGEPCRDRGLDLGRERCAQTRWTGSGADGGVGGCICRLRLILCALSWVRGWFWLSRFARPEGGVSGCICRRQQLTSHRRAVEL